MPTYRPWRYMNREDVRRRDSEAFRNNTQVFDEQKKSEPPRPFAIDNMREEKKKGGGNPFGKALGVAKNVGGKALDVLDVAAETTRDIAEPGLRAGPAGAAFKLGDVLGITDAPKNRTPWDFGGTTANVVRSRGDIRDFGRRQKADLEDRSPIDRLATQVAFDPTNIVGAGIATKALRGAAAARQGTKTARILSGAARANEIVDATQARFAREAIGGTVGFTSSALSGGDTEQNLQAAGLGILAGRASRYIGKKGPAAAAVARQFPLGASIDETHPKIDEYVAALDEIGVKWGFDDDGVIVLEDGADEIINWAEGDAMMMGVSPSRGGAISRGGGDLPGDTRRSKEVWGKTVIDQDKTRTGLSLDANIGDFWDPTHPAHARMNAVERAREVMAEGSPNPALELARSEPWAEGSVLRNGEVWDDATRAAREQEYFHIMGSRSKADTPAKEALGIDDANRVIAKYMEPFDTGSGEVLGRTPATTKRSIMAEIFRKEEDIRLKTGGKTTPRERAYLHRLHEAYDAIDAAGHDAAIAAPRGTAGDVLPAAGSGNGDVGATATVKRIDLEGNVTDTFQTEAELAGIRAQQGDLIATGEAQAKRAALETEPPAGPRPRPVGEPPVVPVASGDAGVVGVQRAETPEGYIYGVPEGHVPQYRRTQTQESLALQKSKPTPGPLGDRPKYSGTPDQILSDWADDVSNYHPNLAQPHDRLGQDYEALKAAARSAYRKDYLKEIMEASGIDASDLKDDPHLARALRKEANAAARKAVQEVEDDVLREGFWEPIADTSRGDSTGGRLTGGVGGQVGEPTGVPDIPVKEPPPPSVGRGGTRPFGADAPTDLLNTRRRATVIARAAGRRVSRVGQGMEKVRSALGRLKVNALDDTEAREAVKPFGRERERIAARIDHVSSAIIDTERRVLSAAGIEVSEGADGYWHMIATGKDVGYFDDVIEQTSDAGKAAYAALSEEQRAALAVIGEHNKLLNGTQQFHGAEPRIDPEIEGDYFGRRVTAKTYEAEGGPVTLEKHQGVQQSRRVGAERMKSRVLENIEDLEARGFTTENPWTARLAITRGKLMTAEDAYLKGVVAPLAAQNPGSGFGLAQVVGHPIVNNEWFQPETAKAIQKLLDPPAKPPAVIAKVNSYLTPLRASFDVSGTLQQGLRMWLTNPKDAAAYWTQAMRSLADDAVYDRALNRLDAEGPGLLYHAQHNLRFTGETAADEMLFPVPGGETKVAKGIGKAFEKSNQAFSRVLNLYRLSSANRQYERLRAAGFVGGALDEAVDASNTGINRSFGWTDTRPTTLEQAAVFAPKYTRATVETLVKAVTDRAIEGQMARRHMALMIAEGAALVTVLNAVRGYDTEYDPRSNNFLRLRNVGGLDVSPFGTYNTLFRAIAQGIAGEGEGFEDITVSPFQAAKAPIRFAEGKLSPALGLLWWPAKGETYLGEPLEPLSGPEGLGRTALEMGKSSLPFGAQNLIQEGPVAAVVGSVGLSNTPVTATEKRDFRRDAVAREMFGQSYDSLSGADKSRVNEDEQIRNHQEDADRNALTRSGDRSKNTQVTMETARKIDNLSAALQAGQITGNEWREQYQKLQSELRGARDILKLDGKSDATVDGWFALYDQAELPDGRLNYELLDQLQETYRREHPDIDEKVDRIVGSRDNATVREYRQAREIAERYYAIPAYRGMSVQDGQKAGQALNAASDMVRYGMARNRDDALRQIARIDPTAARLAREAERRGSNPARERFRKDPANALFARFYSDAPVT